MLLEISEPVSFETDGLFVTTPEADTEHGLVRVAYETAGADGVSMQVLSPAGETVAEGSVSGAAGTVEMVVPSPALWSPDSPSLYTLAAHCLKDGQVTDTRRVVFGIRSIRFDCNEGFFLNGVNMKLKGLCVHHDAGALGAAVPKAVWRRRLLAFKAAGCNALRTAHNPPDPQLLDLCDELGLLVMDEAFDEWEGIKNKWWQGHNVYPPKNFGYGEDFPQWYRLDLEGMVKRDRNHPCIILWSIGNEIDYPNDPYVTPLFKEVLGNNDANKPLQERLYDVRRPDAGRLAVLARELTEIVHGVDTTRPVTSAMSFPELSTRTGYADALDASGYNYKEKFYAEDHIRFPDRVIYGSENSHSPEAWHFVRDNSYICGQFLWTGIDFLGECRGWPVRISQAGMLDLAGYPKTLFYQRKAMWTKAPFVKLAVGGERVWEQGLCWCAAGNKARQVAVYTNRPEAELFLNGRSLGVKPVGEGYCAVWQVPYEDGVLEAVSGDCRDVLRTPEKAASLSLQVTEDELPGGGRLAQAEVLMADAHGTPVAEDARLHVQLLGDARLWGIENGRPDDLTPYAEPWRETYHGRAIIYIRGGDAAQNVLLHVWTDSGLSADVRLFTK